MRFRIAGTNWEGRLWTTSSPIGRLALQIDAAHPQGHPTDGTVASKAHDAASPNSDHRPHPFKGAGIVRAIDIGVNPGDPRFIALLDEIEGIHAAKQRDYGTAADPFANVRASEELGIPGWIGGLIRMNDKMRRLNKAARQVIAGEPVNMAFDGPLDDLKDLAVYSLIGVVLYKEQNETP